MPTKLLRTQKTYTAPHSERSKKTGERTGVVDNNGLYRQRELGASKSQSPQTIPRESKSSGDTPDKTPSARAKVLPWVQGVQTSEGSIPEGMFGPYTSRPQSLTEPQLQSRHPYAAMPSLPSLPFAALGAGHQLGKDPATASELMKNQRPESEAFSRGAGAEGGMKRPYFFGNTGVDTPGGMSGTSPGMGTFGLEGKEVGSKMPTALGSSNKTPIPTQAPNPVGLPESPRQGAPQPKVDSDQEVQYHIHKPHHKFPFSHAEAEAKQREGMEDARAAALAQLEAAQHIVDAKLESEMMEILGMMSGARLDGVNAAGGPGGNAPKGPRQTFDTNTSGPSFGHILHQDGVPISACPSMRVAPEGFASGRPLTELSEVFRIPFGVPIGMSIPRPLMVMRDSAGAPGDLGLGMPALLNIIQGHGEGSPLRRKQEDRSAYVETVEDEEEVLSPIRTDVRTEVPSKTSSPAEGAAAGFGSTAQSVPQGDVFPAKTESNVLGDPSTAKSNAGRIGFTAHSPSQPTQPPTEQLMASTAHPLKTSTHHAHHSAAASSKVGSKTPGAKSKVPSKAASKAATTAASKLPTALKAPKARVPSVGSQATTVRLPPATYTKGERAMSHAHVYPQSQARSQVPFPTQSQCEYTAVPEAPSPGSQAQSPPQLDQKTIYSQVRKKNTPTIIPGQFRAQEYFPSTQSANDAVEHHHELEKMQGATGEGSIVASQHGSVAPTTMSNVKRIVDASRYHDETLCQLLDAARLNLIGEEAKKALQRAARARVIELRELRAAGELEVGLLSPAVVLPSHAEETPKRAKRSKSKEKGRTVSGKSANSAKSEKGAAKQEPPIWAQDIMNRLSMFDHRFAALETQKDTRGPHKSQVSRDMRSKLIEELIFNDLHSSIFTNGINTPHGSTNSVPFGQSVAAPMPAAPLTASEDISFSLGQKQRAASDMPSHYSHKPLSQHVPGIATCTQYGGTQTPVQYAPSQVPATQYVPTQPPPTQYSQQAGAASQVRSVGPLTERRPSAQGDLIWGSEVELPHPNESISFPHIAGPTINVLPPTESNMGNNKASTRASPRSRTFSASKSHPSTTVGGRMAPDDGRIDVITEQPLSVGAMPDPREKELPPQPSESVKNQPPDPTLFDNMTAAQRTQPGTVTGSAIPKNMAQSAYSYGPPDQYPPSAPRLRTANTQVQSAADVGVNAGIVTGSIYGTAIEPPTTSFFPGQTMRHIAVPGTTVPPAPVSPMHSDPVPPTSQPFSEPLSTIHMRLHETKSSPFTATAPGKSTSAPRDCIHVVDPLFSPMAGWKPWDMLTQRLYSWALIMEEKSFVRALEDISLGRQVEAFPLSVFLMLAYKRWVRRNLSETTAAPCDKLFVPPNLAVAINIAVHSRRYHEAKEILLELWDCLGMKEHPRIIVALAPLGDETDQWAAHRYDLSSKHLTTYRVSHLAEIRTDGRSFWWWEAIRQAWPELQIPEMQELEKRGGQRIINEHRPPEYKHDNSLYAANISRNLLLGYRPERQHDLVKQREIIWAEVKRLLHKKRTGRLVVEPDSPEHLYDT